MKESQFGFEYTWEDVQPVRLLVVIILAAQVIGAGIGLWLVRTPEWFDNLFIGGALASLPGFAVGALAQHHAKPGSLNEHFVMVRRMGIMAAFLSAIALVIWARGGHAG